MADEAVKNSFSHDVSQTLWIPLLGRATAAKWHPDFKDPIAESITQKISPNTANTNERTKVMSVVRAHFIDKWAREFFKINPRGTLINLGSGFCTRFFRVDNGLMSGVDVDFDSVLRQKELLLPK